MTIDKALQALKKFQGESLTKSLSGIEHSISGLDAGEMKVFCETRSIDSDFMDSAIAVKEVAGQINVIIHAAGILHSLPDILEPGEVVESVSLGAGNTGRLFDLETNLRIAEYKFIHWKGGAESIRQNGLFKDFFSLAEYKTHKKKYLYVIEVEYPLRFLRGGRALTSVLSRYPQTLAYIREKYGEDITTVRDYYKLKESQVQICDITPHIGIG